MSNTLCHKQRSKALLLVFNRDLWMKYAQISHFQTNDIITTNGMAIRQGVCQQIQ